MVECFFNGVVELRIDEPFPEEIDLFSLSLLKKQGFQLFFLGWIYIKVSPNLSIQHDKGIHCSQEGKKFLQGDVR